jgi:hypothetical protein
VLQFPYLAKKLAHGYRPAIGLFSWPGRSVMARLLIAVVVGAVLAVGAAFLVSDALAGVTNGAPSNASLYQYGTR